MGSTSTPECVGYCDYLGMCNSCLFDANGECVNADECATICVTEVPSLAAQCISDLAQCDEAAFGACYDDNIGEDDCAETCRLLEECGECFVDENNECLSLAGCAVVCRDVVDPMIATCLAEANECSGIDRCYEEVK